jgi:hypothetical protein
MPDKYNVDMTLGELLDDEISGKYLREALGEAVVDNPRMQMALGFSIRQIQEFIEQTAPGRFPAEKLEELDAGLRAL